uniref:Uncharacterized protein n=1 Tax=Pleurozia purpurea TaxID=280637 RepID=D0R018_9MARC|nr:hypothetical protein PlpuMp18 [Pleurozia purpurea]ACR19355.1 hypothetical protein PlpuMp18 [Pleurozia purpurea]
MYFIDVYALADRENSRKSLRRGRKQPRMPAELPPKATWFYEHSGFAGLHHKFLRPLLMNQILMTGVRRFIGCSWRVIAFNNYGFLLMFIMQKFIEFLLAYFVFYLLGA